MATEEILKTKKERNNPLFYLFGKTWHYSDGNRKNIILYWFMFIIANATQYIFQPLVMAKIMDTIQKEGITSENIKFLLGFLMLTLAIEIFFWSFHGPARVIERINAFKVRANYRKYLLKGVMTLPMEWHTDHHSGDTIDKVEKGTNALYLFSEESFDVISALVKLVISYVMLVYFSHPAAYIVLAMILISVWITTRFDKVLIGQYKELNHSENHISESVFDAISNITTVIILRVERLVFNAIAGKIERPFALFRKNNAIGETKWFLTSICCTVMAIVVLGVYFWRNIATPQGVLIGSVYLLIKYLDNISDLFFKFTGMYGEILLRKTKVMNAEELSKEFKTENFTNHVLPSDWHHIQLDNLCFSYHSEEGAELNLGNVSLSMVKGERIALVGESGSGKTTLLKIIRNLYSPQNLKLKVDGEIIFQGFEGICRAISLVPQNPEIFATTILENITLGAEYDMATVRHFTDMACFTDVVERLPRKFDSSINERGVNLSGGEQQRLALTRGLLACSDKPIVLLDEPTSSIDLANEMRIYQNIFQEFENKTIIASIHRLHLLPLFHRIYMFDNGHIVGSGTLNELLSSCPLFLKLWQQYGENQQDVRK